MTTEDGYDYIRKYYSLMGRDINTLTMPLYDNTMGDYQNKFSKKIESFKGLLGDIETEITNKEIINVWVIDMQNDFIDASFEDVNLANINKTDNKLVTFNQHGNMIVDRILDNNGNGVFRQGRFAVKEGKQCVDDVIYYLNKIKVLAENKVVNIFFSRDVHAIERTSVNHCSFKSSEDKEKYNGSGFPAHCVNGTNGCKLHKDIEKWINNVNNNKPANINCYVTYKGFDNNIESFGAYPYICNKKEDNDKYFLNKYVESRQHNSCNGKCSNDNGKIEDTGSFILKENNSAILNFKRDIEAKTFDFSNNVVYNDSDRINVNKQSVKEFLDEKYKEDKDKANVLNLVCGLAGDYCVRDTAFNLRADGYDNTYVIADATRYAILDYQNVIKKWFTIETSQNDDLKNLHKLIKRYQMNPVKMNGISGIIDNSTNLLETSSVNELDPSNNYQFFLTPPTNILFTYGFNPLTDKKVFLIDKTREEKLDAPSASQTEGQVPQSGGKRKNRNKIRTRRNRRKSLKNNSKRKYRKGRK